MACTLLRIVQAAVNLRRRFECAIQSSFESVESGEVLEDHRALEDTEENEDTLPREEDVSTSEHLSENFQLSFSDPDEHIGHLGDPNENIEHLGNPNENIEHLGDPDENINHLENLDESIEQLRDPDENTENLGDLDENIERLADRIEPSNDDVQTDKMTFIHSDDQKEAEEKENGAYKDALTSSSIEIIEENDYISEDIESGNEQSPTENGDSKTTVECGKLTLTEENSDGGAIHKIPTVQVNEISGSDSSSSDSDSSDSRCSIKSVRLRVAEAVSPSSGCKPAKMIKSDDLPTSEEKESETNQQWILLVKESGSQLIKESEKENSNSESDVDKNEFLGYSEWLLKGKVSAEGDTSSSDGSDVLFSPKFEGSEEDDDSESYLEDEDEVMVDESFDDSFVDDGFVSLDVDEYDDDVIIEENESDLEKERLEEEMLEEMKRSFEEGPGRADTPEHRKLSRQYSPAFYLSDPLPGIPETKVVIEGKDDGTGSGRLRYTSSYRGWSVTTYVAELLIFHGAELDLGVLPVWVPPA